MLKRILGWFRRHQAQADVSAATERAHFDQLDRNAPLRAEPDKDSQRKTEALTPPPAYLSREAILGRDQRIAGYQFMLHEGTRNRIRHSSRRVHHLYAEVLVRNLVSSQISVLLGHRFALLALPDSFFGHACLDELSPANTVLMPVPHRDEEDAPTLLREQVLKLRSKGFRLALPDPLVFDEYRELLDLAAIVVIQGNAIDVRRGAQLKDFLALHAPQARLLLRDLPLLEHFQLAFKLGSNYFQGPFITSRERWDNAQLCPKLLHLSKLINRLRADGDTHEIATLLKQDAALALRLLRSVNTTGHAQLEPITSLEHALIILGRDRLYRWLVMLAFTADSHGGRISATLETALVRGRMLELLSPSSQPSERDALFLVGLLSLADLIMQRPLAEAIAPLALPAVVSDTLLDSNGPYQAHLALAIACEEGLGEDEAGPPGQRSTLAELAARCRITPEQATQAHLEALLWAMEVQQ